MGLQLDSLPGWFNDSVVMLVIATAVWKGGRVERVGALVMAFQLVNDDLPALAWTVGPVTDAASLGAFLWLVLRSSRYWTIWAAASAVLSLSNHALYAIFPAIGSWAYLSANVAWSYALLAALLYGSVERRGSSEAHARALE